VGRLYDKGGRLCRYGHVKEGRNLYITPEGWRVCVTCKNLDRAASYWKGRMPGIYLMDKFTSRERDVWRLVSLGLDDREIASLLHLALTTVRNYVTTLYQELELTGSTTLAKRVVLAKLYKEPVNADS